MQIALAYKQGIFAFVIGSTLINCLEIPEPYQFMGLEVPHLVDGVLYASLNCAITT